MKSVIVGTAGHIDHGKTSLVKALTGIDADRLEEEKRRGITIDLGFAHLELPAPSGEKLRLGFVDVPGHERFVRNMLAGVGGIDLVLLVIAADESIKPQTREHFDICRLLSIRRGITVITKSDAVDADTLDVVKLEVEEFLKGSFLDPNGSSANLVEVPGAPAMRGTQSAAGHLRAPIVAVSSLTGAGFDELKRELARIAAEVPARDASALARLPIDRVFTMKGFGTVVTGTLVSGTIRKEDELEVFATGKRVRVRGVQVHGSSAEQAIAGQRTALNLAGAATEDLARGMTVAPPDTFRATSRVDVSLSLLPSARPLKDRARVHLHAFTFETVAEVALYGEKQVKPGATAYAQLRLAEPALLLPGDRFILRQFSPVITIGGGVVLDATPLARTKKDAILPFLKTLDGGQAEAAVTARIARRGQDGLSLTHLTAETGWRTQALQKPLTEALKSGTILLLADRYVHRTAIEGLKIFVAATVDAFHKKNPLVGGISKEELRETTAAPPEVATAVLDLLVREKKLELVGELVRLPGRGVVMKDDEAESKKIIENAFASAGLQVPALKDVLASVKIDKTRAQKIVTLLLRDKVLLKISEDLVFHQSAIAKLRQQIIALKAKAAPAAAKIDVGKFKDLTGVTRKYAIPLLEYLDRERVTKRVGDERVIL
jgi:selenocysteine-specific elongation factor